MITGYFDESEGESHSVVAGFLAEQNQLCHLEREWQSLLREYGLRFLHMKDFAHSNGEFASWRGRADHRKRFLERAIGIISRRSRMLIGVTIEKKGFAEVYSSSGIFPHLYKNEYAAASMLTLTGCSSWAGRWSITDPISYVFDRGNQQRPHFQWAFDTIRANPLLVDIHYFGSLTFEDDAKVPQLQAADLIAYELNKLHSDAAKGISRRRRSMDRLLNTAQHRFIYADSDFLKTLAKKTAGLEWGF